MRLDRLLAQEKISRKAMKQALLKKEILVNDCPALSLAQNVDTGLQKLVFQGRQIQGYEHNYLMLHKPGGVVTASKDTYTSVEQYAAYARELAEKNPYVSIADWNKVAKEHPEIWAGTDQVHFGNDSNMIEEGAKLYAETIAAAVKAAQELPVKSK